MTNYILGIAAIMLICIALNKISSKIGIPMLLAFIILGMLFGSDGIVKIPFDNFTVVEQICSVALIFIMFYGGFGTSWRQARCIAGSAIALSSLGVILTAFLTGLFCYFVLKFSFLESMLVGSVISSTDAASVFSILRSKRLNLKDNTASLLEIESGSNDPCSYMLAVIVLAMMSGDLSGTQLTYMIFAQVVFGVAIGVGSALVAAWCLTKIKFATDGFDTIFVFTIPLIAYGVSSVLGGNGYLSTYILGIILGNKSIPNKKSLVHFFDGITGLMQMLIFFLLGLLSFPSELPKIVLPSLGIALFITFIARPIAVFAILAPTKGSWEQKLLVAWSGLRGAASIVFAIMATVSPMYMKNDIFHIVFFIVLFSIGIQGSLIPFMAKKLKMIDDDSNVMKTFSDYSDEEPIQFIKLLISPNHLWNNKKIKEVLLPPDLLIALIIRDNQRIIPKGNTTIIAGDILVLSALSAQESIEAYLVEVIIEEYNPWLGKTLAEITLEPEKLIIMIKRHNKIIIPNGKTLVKKDDILVISQS